MYTREELIKQKKKVESLSVMAKESYESLRHLCNEISFAENLDSVENRPLEADDLIYILSERIIDHLKNTHSSLSAYKKYSEMLEKLNPQLKIGEKEG